MCRIHILNQPANVGTTCSTKDRMVTWNWACMNSTEIKNNDDYGQNRPGSLLNSKHWPYKNCIYKRAAPRVEALAMFKMNPVMYERLRFGFRVVFDTQGLVLLLSIKSWQKSGGVHGSVVARALVYGFMYPSSILALFFHFPFFSPYTVEIFLSEGGACSFLNTQRNGRFRQLTSTRRKREKCQATRLLYYAHGGNTIVSQASAHDTTIILYW